MDEMAMIQLKRKKNGPPLIIYNYNTVSPITRACLSTYSYDADDEPVFPDDPDDIERKMYMAEKEALSRDANYRREITKKKFKLYSETATFVVDQDIDYLACESHLLNIGFTEPGSRGRLCNYPPHVYMSLVDYNDKYFPNRPIVPLYTNLEHKIAITREIIERKIAKGVPKDGKKFGDMMYANYGENDTRRYKALLTKSDHGDELVRRSKAMVAKDRTRTESNVAKFKHHNRSQIMSTVSHISCAPSMITKKPVQKRVARK